MGAHVGGGWRQAEILEHLTMLEIILQLLGRRRALEESLLAAHPRLDLLSLGTIIKSMIKLMAGDHRRHVREVLRSRRGLFHSRSSTTLEWRVYDAARGIAHEALRLMSWSMPSVLGVAIIPLHQREAGFGLLLAQAEEAVVVIKGARGHGCLVPLGR